MQSPKPCIEPLLSSCSCITLLLTHPNIPIHQTSHQQQRQVFKLSLDQSHDHLQPQGRPAMSPPAQRDVGDLNAAGFPIRFNNGTLETDTQETNSTQSQHFASLAEMRSSLPPSCELIEYVRSASQPLANLHASSPPILPNPSYVPRMPLPNQSHDTFTQLHPTGPPPLPVPAYIPGTPIPNHVYSPGTTMYRLGDSITSQPSLPGPVPNHPYGLRSRYTLASSSEPPHLRVAMLPTSSALSPAQHIPHDPFPSAPISSGSFTHGAFPETSSSSSSSASDQENIDVMSDSLPNDLASMSLYPNPDIVITDFSAMTIDPTSNSNTEQPPQPIRALCTSPQCLVPEPHAQGLYLFGGLKFHLKSYCADGIARSVFGESNPPPRVWEGLDRLAQGMGEEEDARAVEGFQQSHFVL